MFIDSSRIGEHIKGLYLIICTCRNTKLRWIKNILIKIVLTVGKTWFLQIFLKTRSRISIKKFKKIRPRDRILFDKWSLIDYDLGLFSTKSQKSNSKMNPWLQSLEFCKINLKPDLVLAWKKLRKLHGITFYLINKVESIEISRKELINFVCLFSTKS